jgi:hypothetical protein
MATSPLTDIRTEREPYHRDARGALKHDDRSDDYEALPQTPFVLIGLPIPMAVVVAGVGAATLWRRIRSAPDAP